MSSELDSMDRGPPSRHLDKQEAVRHLVHGAIRLIMAREDPFVIQLVAHSADKMLGDIAKKKGTYLELDWELLINNEHHREFFADYRETYNYFKHANTDFTKLLPIYDIARLNVMAVFMCAVNYNKLFEVPSHHVRAYLWFIQLLMPSIIKASDPKVQTRLQEGLEQLIDVTPAEFFELVRTNAKQFDLDIEGEIEFDLHDVAEFYRTSISELRSASDQRRQARRQEQS